MNLPELHPLQNDRSTYIRFSKSDVDLDKAIANDTKWYFSKMVALKLPNWSNPDFYADLNSIGIVSTNPNTLLPKVIQYYMENIIRQEEMIFPEITEIAFWKTLKYLGLNETQVRDTVKFVNSIMLSNYIETENNNGWAEIITQVPNHCDLLLKSWKNNEDIPDIIQTNDTDTALYDNGSKQFLFSADDKQTLDFENLAYDTVTESEFDFNTLLLFYMDDDGIEKLHGINFIYPFENKVSYWDMELLNQKTNVLQTIGYQFKFNMKTCNNEATLLQVYNSSEHVAWQQFSSVLGKMDSFLENKIRENDNTIF